MDILVVVGGSLDYAQIVNLRSWHVNDMGTLNEFSGLGEQRYSEHGVSRKFLFSFLLPIIMAESSHKRLVA